MCVSSLQVDSEEPVFEAVINWVKHSKKEREASLPELLQYVRMPLLTPRYITDVIDTEVPAAGPWQSSWELLSVRGRCAPWLCSCCPNGTCQKLLALPMLLDADTTELSLFVCPVICSEVVCCASRYSILLFSWESIPSRAINQLSAVTCSTFLLSCCGF